MKAELISQILDNTAEYNRRTFTYGKDSRRYGTAHKLRYDQVHLIDLIGKNPNCNLHSLVAVTDSSVPTVSLQVDRLKKLGLVTKCRSAANQREIEINLTDEGRLIYSHHEKLDREYNTSIIESLDKYTDDQLQTILSFLADLLNNEENFLHNGPAG